MSVASAGAPFGCLFGIDVSEQANHLYAVLSFIARVDCSLIIIPGVRLPLLSTSHELTVIVLSVLLLTRSSAIAVDVIVLALTFVKTFTHWRQLRQLKLHSSVVTLLLVDGELSCCLLRDLQLNGASNHFIGTAYFM